METKDHFKENIIKLAEVKVVFDRGLMNGRASKEFTKMSPCLRDCRTYPFIPMSKSPYKNLNEYAGFMLYDLKKDGLISEVRDFTSYRLVSGAVIEELAIETNVCLTHSEYEKIGPLLCNLREFPEIKFRDEYFPSDKPGPQKSYGVMGADEGEIITINRPVDSTRVAEKEDQEHDHIQYRMLLAFKDSNRFKKYFWIGSMLLPQIFTVFNWDDVINTYLEDLIDYLRLMQSSSIRDGGSQSEFEAEIIYCSRNLEECHQRLSSLNPDDRQDDKEASIYLRRRGYFDSRLYSVVMVGLPSFGAREILDTVREALEVSGHDLFKNRDPLPEIIEHRTEATNSDASYWDGRDLFRPSVVLREIATYE